MYQGGTYYKQGGKIKEEHTEPKIRKYNIQMSLSAFKCRTDKFRKVKWLYGLNSNKNVICIWILGALNEHHLKF